MFSPILYVAAFGLPLLHIFVGIVRVALLAAKRGNDPVGIWDATALVPFVGHAQKFRSWLFGALLRRVNPYSASIPLTFVAVKKGLCEASTREVHAIRNPFRSVHAAALVLLGETVGGLAVFTTLRPKQDRAIVSALHARYFKKARGVVTAKCTFAPPTAPGEHQVKSVVELKNAQGDLVAEVDVIWQLTIGVDKQQ